MLRHFSYAMKMKGKTSSIFKKCLKDSGFDLKFDTIMEADDEDRTENDSAETAAETLRQKRPVSPKRVRKLSNMRRNNIPSETLLPKGARREREMRYAQTTFNNQLNALLHRTNSLQEDLSKGRQAIEQTLDTTIKLVASDATPKARTDVKKPSPTSNLADQEARVFRRGRPFKPWPRTVMAKPHAKSSKTDAQNELNSKTVSVPEIKHAATPKRVSFAAKDFSPTLKQKEPTRERSLMRDFVSLPNLNVVHVIERPRSKSLQGVAARKLETGKSLFPDGASSARRKSLITLRPPAASNLQRRSLRYLSHAHDDAESVDSKSTRSSDTTDTKSTKSSDTTSIASDKSYGKNSQKQCFKTQSGDMVKMANLMAIVSSKPSPQDQSVLFEETWKQIQHCRYLRNYTAPDFCTCSQCEKCIKESQ